MEVLKIRLDKDSPWIEIPAIVGPPGPKGADGNISFNDLTEEQKASLKGDTGPAGERGPAGPQGPVGPRGADGTMSFTDLTPEQKESLRGPAGPQGEPGPIGPIGLTGPQGEPGIQGLTGPAGPAGPIGETGPAGPKGDSYVITEDDKNEIAQLVYSMFPSGEGVEY